MKLYFFFNFQSGLISFFKLFSFKSIVISRCGFFDFIFNFPYRFFIIFFLYNKIIFKTTSKHLSMKKVIISYSFLHQNHLTFDTIFLYINIRDHCIAELLQFWTFWSSQSILSRESYQRYFILKISKWNTWSVDRSIFPLKLIPIAQPATKNSHTSNNGKGTRSKNCS